MSRSVFCVLLLAGLSSPAAAQPETMAWGNLTGIRIDGHLMELNSSMCVAQPDWSAVSRTGRERQTNSYSRKGKIETVAIQMIPPRPLRTQGVNWAFAAAETVEDVGPGTARVDVEYRFHTDADIAGAYYCLELPASLYSGGFVQLIGAESSAPGQVSLAPGPNDQNEYLRVQAAGARFVSPHRQIEVAFNEPTEIVIRDDRRENSFDIQVYFAVIPGKAVEGQSAKKSFAFKVGGEPDASPVTVTVDPTRPGQMFDGLGGNFRLQNARTDPAVIQYNLDSLRIAWGRVELPWALWHPNEESDPLADARAGKIHPRVSQAMDMARTLARKGIPVIVSAWSAPQWAVLGGRGGPAGPQPPLGVPAGAAAPVRALPGFPVPSTGPRGNPLNPEKMDRIRESIAGYLLHLKEKYGAEAAMFSFNESDLGINVRQTPREHSELIKTLGPYFASRGLATRLALGDTSDANPIEFIRPAMHDPEAVKYIAAVDFHSWRGCTDEILAQWRDAARALNVPLLVAEGSTDAAAYRYPQILLEPSFAFYEINLYTRILNIAQPKSILQWQMTADYSLLAGGGVFGDSGPLRPTQRYWNLKQFASTPPRSFVLPVKCDKPGVTCAALGNIAEGVYTLHIVNNSGRRPAALIGFPPDVKQLRLWVTDAHRGMEEMDRVAVTGGKAELTLEPTSFTTLVSAR
ncbi:MAG TPA: hypothetical protein VMH28_33075 [Candidatus Acidoferrales bacterium]|nr:hypothetical protein [Candidatus Acidoferrales bacterium]